MKLDGWRIALGICKDTGTMAHLEVVAALNFDLYAAGILHHSDPHRSDLSVLFRVRELRRSHGRGL